MLRMLALFFFAWMEHPGKHNCSGLLALMQRLIAHVMKQRMLATKEQINTAACDSVDFSRLVALCEGTLRLSMPESTALQVAVAVVSRASHISKIGLDENLGSCVAPDLDELVLLFRHALLVDVSNPARSLQRWREFETDIGLPHIDMHLSVLGRKAKGVLLGLSLVPEGVPQTAMIVNRDRCFMDAQSQLPRKQACVLACYFESASGTKFIEGRRVEGGEGHGPRKEFFSTASADALRRWTEAEVISADRMKGGSSISFKNNRISFDMSAGHAGMSALFEKLCIGDRLVLRLQDGNEVAPVITGKAKDGSLIVDGGVKEGTLEGANMAQCEIQKPAKPLFEFHRGTGQMWFSAYSSEIADIDDSELRQRYNSFGKLLALALANHCKLSFVLPVIFFRILMRRKDRIVLNDLKGFDNALYSSLRKCLKMRQAQFAAIKEVDGLPADLSREDYVAQQVQTTMNPAAMDEVRRGFESMASLELLREVTASELRQILCPTDTKTGSVNIRHVFEVVVEDEMADCSAFVEAFWNVIDKFSLEETRLFLLFVTGVDSPPEPGTEQLMIQLPFSAFSQEEHVAMLNMLPQAHTCTNTLELPNYHEALLQSGKISEDQHQSAVVNELQALLREKLHMAIHETAGYELDGGIVANAIAGGDDRSPSTVVATRGMDLEQKPRRAERQETWELPHCPQNGLGKGEPSDAAPSQSSQSSEVCRPPSTLDSGDAPLGDSSSLVGPITSSVEKAQPRHGVDALLDDLDGVLKSPL